MNKCYIITYGLMTPNRNYELLYNAIKSYGTWGKITETSWMIVTTASAANIRDNLSSYMGVSDRLFVSRVAIPSAWRNTIATDDWVKKNLETYGQ